MDNIQKIAAGAYVDTSKESSPDWCDEEVLAKIESQFAEPKRPRLYGN